MAIEQIPTVFRNFAGRQFRNVQLSTKKAERNLARVTGLEPATSGVTGRAFPEPKQRPFRKSPARNDARAAWRPETAFGTQRGRMTG